MIVFFERPYDILRSSREDRACYKIPADAPAKFRLPTILHILEESPVRILAMGKISEISDVWNIVNKLLREREVSETTLWPQYKKN